MLTKIEQIIIAATIDAMIEDIIKECQEKEKLLNNLIGKTYFPKEISYTREIINGEKMNYHCSLVGVPCKIISHPYIIEIQDFPKNKKERMIKVKSLKTGLIYEVPFVESWICD